MIKRLNFPDQAKVKEFAKNTGLNELQAAILLNRGYEEKDAEVIGYNISALLSPNLMLNAPEAAKQIKTHITNKGKIVLYSDYDADGWGAAIIGLKMIQEIGGDIEIYINERSDGYGINKKGVDKLLNKWPDTKLILTADNGIVAFEAVDYVKSLGIDIVVTDHHQPSPDGKLPNCICVNPHIKEDTYPFKDLCGAAVLWKVLTICYFLNGINPEESYKLLDIVTLSTIADVVPLYGENRVIVKEGLKKINAQCRPQWEALRKRVCSYSTSPMVTAKDMGWNFGPAINAISRMSGSIMSAIDLFLTDDPEKIEDYAETLASNNDMRKALTTDQFNASLVLANEIASDPAIIVAHPEFSEGLIGLVAGRLKEAYYKPSICFTTTPEGDLKGSGRSIPGINIKDILDKIQAKKPILKAYGGHSSACGLTIDSANFDDFSYMFNEICDEYPEETFIQDINIDAVFKDGELNEKVLDSISYLEPFGSFFEEPVIMVKDIEFIGAEKFKDDRHLKIICDGFEIICWNCEDRFDIDEIRTFSKVTAFGNLDKSMQLIIEYSDIKFA